MTKGENRWLGHVGKMTDDNLPKYLGSYCLQGHLMDQNLDGEIWCSVIYKTVFDSTSWYAAAHDQAKWYHSCQAIPTRCCC